MFIHCYLVILILALTLDGQVHTGEIIGGQEAKAHSRPYMVLLKGEIKNNMPKYCGGFLLSADFVMTAAHCQASHSRSYTVLLGVHDIHNTSEIQSLSVEQAFPHKDYDADTYSNDIMLLKLSSQANFSKSVKPIALAGPDDAFLPTSCIVSGWGKTGMNTKYMSHILMEVNVTLIDDEECQKDKRYCSEGETRPFLGDSGGPLVCEDEKAYGVVSSFTTAPDGTHISSYTKIPEYIDWINSIMKPGGKPFYYLKID
ncbi:hypothetical protein L3Q82_025873 [Scortum barcoo]|uniref:Uncharacterized protein n=1 Tax=Scortum barcoo TaxID=214431 RepID=A0ACB8WMA5_9TELE|nr:hypothetical protein L3Q82_025873 [Scortum barcoo]